MSETFTDEQRREVAAKLRAMYEERLTKNWCPQMIGVYERQYLEDLEKCVPDGKSLFTTFADLIDRPICTGLGEATSLFSFKCSRCGVVIAGWWPNYCPNCGAEVIA